MEHYQSNLRALREAAGLSQEQLASDVGLNKKTIIAMESDHKVSTVKRIMAYLQTERRKRMKLLIRLCR